MELQLKTYNKTKRCRDDGVVEDCNMLFTNLIIFLWLIYIRWSSCVFKKQVHKSPKSGSLAKHGVSI